MAPPFEAVTDGDMVVVEPLRTVSGVLSMKEEKTGNILGLDHSESVIFCNTDRLQRRQGDPGHLYDSKMEEAVDNTDDCALANFMVTTRFNDKPDFIQICPWFLLYTKAKRYGTNSSIKPLRTWLAIKGLDQLIPKVLYTPIDLIDVQERKGYGWKNCRKRSADRDAYRNADSFALLGSALYWGSQGSPIDENGAFTASPASKRWVGSGPGRGLDAVKLEDVKQFL
ncbi:hypothetical protein JX265_012888 [Neoarthrinium moseri]|uniref:Uncharacterized protein n=1 Tax=Neoarthrinium moseri TaxID=1658444 RepID=A0A9Q0AIA2_9PEZI|nr:hypothetical protein JX265_012888 [Neoarthrinium moseri]